jgi:DNA mismatch endonuclease (patch repair protein)
MRAVKGKHTKPELAVRKMLSAMGFRYRLHRKDLPGSPDVVLPGRKKVVFVHGCWWHGHSCHRGARPPATNVAYWTQKITRNQARDASARRKLRQQGWGSIVVWECQLKKGAAVAARLKRFLDRKDDR